MGKDVGHSLILIEGSGQELAFGVDLNEARSEPRKEHRGHRKNRHKQRPWGGMSARTLILKHCRHPSPRGLATLPCFELGIYELLGGGGGLIDDLIYFSQYVSPLCQVFLQPLLKYP